MSHFCGVPEQIGNGNLCRWDQVPWNGKRWTAEPRTLRLTWALATGVDERVAPSLDWAFREWSKVCAVAFDRLATGSAANIVFTHRRIDGPSNTLAWAELPCGPDRMLESRIDASESWHYDPKTPAPRGRVHLGGVMCHEIGHVLGLTHIDSAERALMNATHDPSLLTPQRADIEAAVTRYGPPVDSPADPTPAPAGSIKVRMTTPDGVYAGTLAEVS